MFQVVRWLVVTYLLLGGACRRAADSDFKGIALFDAGRAISVERVRAVQLREQARAMFYRCRPAQAVTGEERAQSELQQLWSRQDQATYALLKDRGGSDSRFAHLKGRDFTLLLGLDPHIGVDPVLTDHEGVLTWYLKCPGLEAMALACE